MIPAILNLRQSLSRVPQAPGAARPVLPAYAIRISGSGLLVLGWFVVVTAGIAALAWYSSRAVEAQSGARAWRPVANLKDPSGPVLLCFVHPRCACSRATLRELERLLTRVHISDVRVLFYRPEQAEDDWCHSALWDIAEGIPDVSVEIDRGGRTARRFDVATSGETLLYDGHGQLRFHGGLTAARGHEGASPGAAAIQAILAGRDPTPIESRVFGCSLWDRQTPESRPGGLSADRFPEARQ